ncbi:restriction endonuclease, partial [Citrobacter freundii]|nr:restriction endonuclease [Citrobacter freundii]
DLSQSNDYNSDNANEKAKEYTEGNKRYITHIIAERNKNVISEVKGKNDWICDICDIEYLKKYNKKYIEAHHKVPLHTFQEQHIITTKDFVLLCPNCHKAVHLYLREENLSYDEAKTRIKNLLKSS